MDPTYGVGIARETYRLIRFMEAVDRETRRRFFPELLWWDFWFQDGAGI